MPSHTLTNPKLKALVAQADEAYMEYLKKMKVLEARARAILARVEQKKTATLRAKLKKTR